MGSMIPDTPIKLEVTIVDQRTDDGRPRTPIERIKAEHDQMRDRILHGDEDAVDWSLDIHPSQVGLKQVWADAKGHLWYVDREDDGTYKLKRIWHLS